MRTIDLAEEFQVTDETIRRDLQHWQTMTNSHESTGVPVAVVVARAPILQ